MGEPIEEPAFTPSREETTRGAGRRLIIVNLIVSVATLIAIIAVAVGVWYYNGSHSAGLPNRVVAEMNAYLSSDEQFKDLGLFVNSITILHAAGNMYEGQAVVTGHDGTQHPVSVHVIYDGEDLLWRTDPGAFLFTVKDALQGAS